MPLLTSERIVQRLQEANLPFHANDNISKVLHESDIADLKKEVEQRVFEIQEQGVGLCVIIRQDPSSLESLAMRYVQWSSQSLMLSD